MVRPRRTYAAVETLRKNPTAASPTAMELTQGNFWACLDEVKKVIDTADFLCVDLEMTGLVVENAPVISSYDAIEHRYFKVSNSAKQFLPSQVGLCAFRWKESEKKYIATPINAYLFQRKFKSVDRSFTSQSSSLEFLSKQKFDFNKWINEGISFLSRQQEEAARASQDRPRSPDIQLSVKDQQFVDRIDSKVAAWISTNESKTGPLVLEPCSSYHRRLIYQEIGKKYHELLVQTATGNNRNCLEVVMMSEEEKAKRREEKKQQIENELREAIGFRHVIDHVIASKKALVGHNMMLDLLHIYHSFIRPLPPKFEDFRSEMHQLFPVIFDTKHLVTADDSLREKIKSSVLSDAIGQLTSEKLLPPVVFPTSNNRYANNEFHHEAGYDAYTTGLLFLYATHAIQVRSLVPSTSPKPQQSPSEKLLDMYPVDLHTSSIEVNKNCLHLMRIRGSLSLTGAHDITPRDRIFLLRNAPTGVNSEVLTAIYTPLCPTVRVSWDMGVALVEFLDDTPMSKQRIKEIYLASPAPITHAPDYDKETEEMFEEMLNPPGSPNAKNKKKRKIDEIEGRGSEQERGAPKSKKTKNMFDTCVLL